MTRDRGQTRGKRNGETSNAQSSSERNSIKRPDDFVERHYPGVRETYLSSSGTFLFVISISLFLFLFVIFISLFPFLFFYSTLLSSPLLFIFIYLQYKYRISSFISFSKCQSSALSMSRSNLSSTFTAIINIFSVFILYAIKSRNIIEWNITVE